MSPLRPARRRNAFTLVELLTVIAIMGILMTLLVVGVRKAMVAANNSTIQVEMGQIAAAIESAKVKWGAYPPCMGSITSGEVSGSLMDRGNRFDTYARKAFPRSKITYSDLKSNMGKDPFAYTYRNSAGGTGTLSIQYIDQAEAIVFWLGGFPSPISSNGQPLASRKLIGFNTNPSNPFQLTVTPNGPVVDGRTPPLYDFMDDRLVDTDNDGWLEYVPRNTEAPYVYFDAALYTNLSKLTDTCPFNMYPTLGSNAPQNGGTSAQLITFGCIGPFLASDPTGGDTLQWANPKSFQLLSAGLDSSYGPQVKHIGSFPSGGVYSGNGFATRGYLSSAEEDNLTNFSDVSLGDAARK
jgi:prepilin-type N-terminal cleavage/methylation domain-containing protein